MLYILCKTCKERDAKNFSQSFLAETQRTQSFLNILSHINTFDVFVFVFVFVFLFVRAFLT